MLSKLLINDFYLKSQTLAVQSSDPDTINAGPLLAGWQELTKLVCPFNFFKRVWVFKSHTDIDLSADAVYNLLLSVDQCSSKTAFLCPFRTEKFSQLL